MKSTHRMIIVIVLVVVAIAAYGILFSLIYSVNEEAQTISKQTLEQQQKVDEQRSLQKLADDIRPNSQQLENFIISKDGDISFIEALETLGKGQGLKLSVASVVEEQQDKFNNLKFQLVLEGSWSPLVHFLELLELMPYKITIRSVAMDIATPWKMSIEMVAVKQK